MSRRTRAALLWVGLICWALGVLWLSSLTPQELPKAAFVLWDKADHVLAYTVGGWLAATAIRASRRGTATATWFVPAVALITVFGVLDEYVQSFTPGRSGGDRYDLVADLVGAVLGALLSTWAYRRFGTRTRPANV
ncbi:MAG: VanZ family protein [Mycobacterium sp.]